jgi:hypothetical protein
VGVESALKSEKITSFAVMKGLKNSSDCVARIPYNWRIILFTVYFLTSSTDYRAKNDLTNRTFRCIGYSIEYKTVFTYAAAVGTKIHWHCFKLGNSGHFFMNTNIQYTYAMKS